MRVAILGANGRVAHEVARAFLHKGHNVIAVTRKGHCEGLTGSVEHRAADAMNRAALIAATAGVDLIFNGLNPLYHEWETKVMPMAENVMAAAGAHKAAHLFVGNVYNYGTQIPVNADENTPHIDDTAKARIRNEMELMFEREAFDNGIQTVILRAGDFYGACSTGSWFDQALASKVDKGVFTWPGPMDTVHAFAYLPDLAAAFVRLGENMARIGVFETFNFEGHSLTGRQFQALVERAMNRKMKTGSLPWWLFRLAGPFNPIMRELSKMSYLWRVAHSLNGNKLAEAFGPIPVTPPHEAVRQALIDLGKLETPRQMAA